MNAVFALVGRNLRLYFRDRETVFSSLLSPLILLALYVFVLGKMQVDSLTEQVPPTVSREDVQAFVNTWVFSGITMITTLTAALGSMGSFVDDRVSGRFQDFVVAPVERWQRMLGTMLSSSIIALIMSFIVHVASQVYLGLSSGFAMDMAGQLQVAGVIVLSCLTFSALATILVSFAKTTGAFSGLSAVVGTFVGFLAGAYIPVGVLSTGVANVMNSLPFSHAAVLMRGPYTSESLDVMTGGSAEARVAFSDVYGITAHVGSLELTPPLMVGAMLIVLVVCSVLGAWRLARILK